MTGLRVGLVLALSVGMLSRCGRKPAPPVLPIAPVKAGPEITVQTTPVPLDAANPAKTALEGGFSYAGGIAITSSQTSLLHGLSDLGMGPDGTLVAISDAGDTLRGPFAAGPGRTSGRPDRRCCRA